MVWNKWRSVSNCGVSLCWNKKCDGSFRLCVCLRGNSKYHYYGIRLKPDSPLNRLQEDTQYMAMRQQPVHQKQRWYKHPPSLLLNCIQSSCPSLLCHQDLCVFVCMSHSIVQILLELLRVYFLFFFFFWFIKSSSNYFPHWLNRWTLTPEFYLHSDIEIPVWVLQT